MKALILSADQFEDSELLYPYWRLREEGFGVEVASLRKGKIRGKRGYEVPVDLSLEEVRPEEYAALILPGGKAPARLRDEEKVLEIVKAFFQAGKPIAAICHGPQILISAGLLEKRRATCYQAVKEELLACGAEYLDQEVVVDGQFITSRRPSDLPAFMGALLRKLRGLEERPGVVAFEGQPLTLVGQELRVGQKAPDFTLVDKDLKPASLKDFSGKVKVISVTPSLDTPVCDLQARRFNQEAAALGEEVVVLNVSVDLPFALARYCASAGIDRVLALSDYRERAFGRAYGLLIKELGLLSRAVLVLDKENIIRHLEIVPEITKEPNYEAALSAVRELR